MIPSPPAVFEQMLELHNNGMSYVDIADRFDMCSKYVSRQIKQYRSNRPKSVADSLGIDRKIIPIAMNVPNLSTLEVHYNYVTLPRLRCLEDAA